MLQRLPLSCISCTVIGYSRFLNIHRSLIAYGDTKKDGLKRSKYLWNGLFDMMILWN